MMYISIVNLGHKEVEPLDKLWSRLAYAPHLILFCIIVSLVNRARQQLSL